MIKVNSIKTVSSGPLWRKLNFSTIVKKSAKANKDNKKYTNTINPIKTGFPVWVQPFKRVELDENILKHSDVSDLYSWQRKHVNGNEYILHDGPPYANGIPHMGHAINKILKDITIRSKLLQGYKINYKPGWDCHGLPIELLATKVDFTCNNLSHIEIRKKARSFATEAVCNQRAVFQSWGIMADWSDDGCYFTFDKGYIKNELQQFYNLYEKGLIYRDFKPVYWSPSSKTALAEAELEYNSDHISTAVTLAIKLVDHEDITPKDNTLYCLIWTTTPWTLPANQAIAFNPTIEYSVVNIDDCKGSYVIANTLIEQISKLIHKNITIIKSISTENLSKLKYYYPFNYSKNEELVLQFLPSDHVTTEKGTGFVHIAPAHGHDDFILCKKYGFVVESFVDEEGKYTKDIGISVLSGLSVLSKECIKKVLSLIQKQCILHVEKFKHSYPYDWRTKQPVILRASQQWFIKTDNLKSKAIEVLKDVKIVPGKGETGFLSLLERRPYWCISRQRLWGVPIPVIYNKVTGEPIITKSLINHYCSLLENYGVNFWWELPLDKLLPQDILIENKISNIDSIDKKMDILDIWLDSGLSWSYVLGNDTIADMYLEGVDQFTGWFQSSLMTSVALRGVPPYKTLFVHGFAVDENGNKMSKSVGNVINPQNIINGGNDHKKEPPYGIDVLRWWVAAHATQHINVPVSKTVLLDSKQCVQKIRSISRFLLGATYDIDDNIINKVHEDQSMGLLFLDKYMLHLLYKLNDECTTLYNNYQYNRLCTQIVNFVTNELSAFYVLLSKDRLYCDHVNSHNRRSAQVTMYNALNVILNLIGPIVPVLAEEIFMYHPLNRGSNKTTLFKSDLNKEICPKSWFRVDVEETMKVALDVQKLLSKELPINSSSWNFSVEMSTNEGTYNSLKQLQTEETSATSQLVDLCQVFSVTLLEVKNLETTDIKVNLVKGTLCERCRRHMATLQDGESDICDRCFEVLSNSVPGVSNY